MDSLYERLSAYGEGDYYPMHMPGHKRNEVLMGMCDPCRIDITEIDGFDNLSHPEGILKELEEEAGALYGGARTFCLVNGSTSGLLAGIGALTRPGDKVLMSRNCHKSVYNAVVINQLHPVYLYPDTDPDTGIAVGVRPEQVERKLKEDPQIRLVILVSPTYEGVLSDVKEIGRAAHSYHVPLLVDGAHGAHFGFHRYFPPSAVSEGADITVHSIHKTLPAFTQTALLHIQGPFISEERMKRYINMYQTTSPSYVLMAGIGRCVNVLREQGQPLFEKLARNIDRFTGQMEQLRHLSLMKQPEGYRKDPSKLVILAGGTVSGPQLADRLRREFHIETEMEGPDYVLAMTGIGDRDEGFQRLAEALCRIDRELRPAQIPAAAGRTLPEAVKAAEAWEVLESECMELPLNESRGRIAGEYISLYPPGIPLLVPGERITGEFLDFAAGARTAGLTLHGLGKTGRIKVDGHS
ncbi:aminotransferase class I/II-fold pyridoxal phosphate-dependent enzyme [Anaerolentibacter hominis]|uniref:aminotransferase class I/II-fold pyridoxal phosphate-dependent enzyme n=1 Tax=Anaerolentibacter hominis TaxID=3079009 RepID=UPI0031B815E6